jgi:hypothetical protein
VIVAEVDAPDDRWLSRPLAAAVSRFSQMGHVVDGGFVNGETLVLSQSWGSPPGVAAVWVTPYWHSMYENGPWWSRWWWLLRGRIIEWLL